MTKSKFYPWLVVGLLWVVALLNYMDRQMLSTMQHSIGETIPALQDPANFGRLMAIFLWIYGLMSPLSGAIADRLSRKWLIIGSLGVWSFVTWMMGYCHSFHQIYWLRGVMGISEALYIPAALSLIADHFTGKGRSLAIGIHMTGLYMGQALGGFGASAAASFSWQSTFHWFGIIGLFYAVVLMVLLREKRVSANPVEKKATEKDKKSVWQGFAYVVSNISFWVILFFFASSSLPGWATKNWLPTMFASSLNITPQEAGPMATITIAVSSFIGVLVGGPLSDRWVKRNIKGRIYTSAIGMAMMIPALVLIGLGSTALTAIAAGLFFGLGYGMFDANNMPILCQFIPTRQRATAYGIMNMVGVFAGALVTEVLGRWADNLGMCFALMSVVLVIALSLQLFVLRPTTDNKE
jgi:MFS family permease